MRNTNFSNRKKKTKRCTSCDSCENRIAMYFYVLYKKKKKKNRKGSNEKLREGKGGKNKRLTFETAKRKESKYLANTLLCETSASFRFKRIKFDHAVSFIATISAVGNGRTGFIQLIIYRR